MHGPLCKRKHNPEATPLAEMNRLLAEDPRNKERIFPYVGGEEVNDSPTHAHRRYVINFGGMTETEARRWPDLMAIVEAKVRPERAKVKRDAHRERWWQYGDKRPALYAGIRSLARALVNCQVSPHLSFAFQPTTRVFAHTLNVFAISTFSGLAALQSRPHEYWARFFGSSMKDDLRYTPSDCFETFPSPPGWETDASMEESGRAYYDFRAALMVRNNEGLTRTHNRFHGPDNHEPDVVELRRLHDAMDRAVLDTYGWTDIQPKCEFLLDYEEEDESEDDGGRKQAKKKPWRYRWPDEIRDEVLARLLALNQERAKEEALAGAAAGASTFKAKKRKSKPEESGSGSLFQ